jgi:hypothetical protein
MTAVFSSTFFSAYSLGVTAGYIRVCVLGLAFSLVCCSVFSFCFVLTALNSAAAGCGCVFSWQRPGALASGPVLHGILLLTSRGSPRDFMGLTPAM